MTTIKGQLFTAREVGELLGCSRQWVNDLFRQGKLPAYETSAGQHLFESADVETLRRERISEWVDEKGGGRFKPPPEIQKEIERRTRKLERELAGKEEVAPEVADELRRAIVRKVRHEHRRKRAAERRRALRAERESLRGKSDEESLARIEELDGYFVSTAPSKKVKKKAATGFDPGAIPSAIRFAANEMDWSLAEATEWLIRANAQDELQELAYRDALAALEAELTEA